MEWEEPATTALCNALSSFSRVIFHEHRGVGLSSRNVAIPNLETRIADILCVLDALGADHVVLYGALSSGATNALLARGCHALTTERALEQGYGEGVGVVHSKGEEAVLDLMGPSQKRIEWLGADDCKKAPTRHRVWDLVGQINVSL